MCRLLGGRARLHNAVGARHAWRAMHQPQQGRAAASSGDGAAAAGAGCAPARSRRQPQVFRFRHFELQQGGAAHKMGTDAMLLGSWVHPGVAAACLDVGTGTGVLAIMLAQRAAPHATVDAIDIEAAAVEAARANSAACAWAPKLRVHRASLQQWAGLPDAPGAPPPSASGLPAAGPQPPQRARYDLLVSNPPFFLSSSKPQANAGRAAARHADETLPFEDLAAGAAALLVPGGRLALVLPSLEAQHFASLAAPHGLRLRRLLRVFTRAVDTAPKRHLMEFDLHGPAATAPAGDAAAAAGHAPASSRPSWAQLQSRAGRGEASFDPAASPGGGPGAPPLDGAGCAVSDLVLNERRYVEALGREAAVFTAAYRQLTADFHDPRFLPY